MPTSEPLCELSTIRLPANDLVSVWLIVAFVPAASTATNVTSARPTVSAAAVTSVRPGWRTEFSRARRAVIPRQLTSQPSAPALPICAGHAEASSSATNFALRRMSAGALPSNTIG